MTEVLTEQQIQERKDEARAVLLRRYEQVWATVLPHVDGSLEADGFRPDPRMVSVGVGVLERLWRLWGLDKPGVESVAAVVSGRELVLERLGVIEARK